MSPIITELVRFIEVSALPADSLNGLQPHEREYRLLLEKDPEKFSCFREQNPTYRRILMTLEEQSKTRDPLFLARWMMWRVYVWGLEAVQGRFGALKSGRDVFAAREKISKRDGTDAIKVKTYLRRPIWAKCPFGRPENQQDLEGGSRNLGRLARTSPCVVCHCG